MHTVWTIDCNQMSSSNGIHQTGMSLWPTDPACHQTGFSYMGFLIPLFDSNLDLFEVPVLLQEAFEFLTLGCFLIMTMVQNVWTYVHTVHTIYDISQRTASFRFVQLQDLFRSCALLLASRITVSTHPDHGKISDQLYVGIGSIPTTINNYIAT